MLTVADVGAMAVALPGVSEGDRRGNLAWLVAGRVFAWQRPFSKADLRRFGGTAPPAGPIVAVGLAGLDEKAAIIATDPSTFFTIPHFDNHQAVLIDLSQADRAAVSEVLLDGWLAAAPSKLVADHFPDGV